MLPAGPAVGMGGIDPNSASTTPLRGKARLPAAPICLRLDGDNAIAMVRLKLRPPFCRSI